MKFPFILSLLDTFNNLYETRITRRIKMHVFERIEINPKILGGNPVFKNTRIPVSIIIQMIRDGASFDKIIQEYPRLSIEDIKSALDLSIYLISHPDEEILTLS